MKKLNSVWISANAGSGKTTALTERVVALMLAGAEPERICCITYTKTAAGEMRARVLRFLRDKLMLADDAARAATVERLLGAAPDAAMLAHARGLFTRVLDSAGGGPQLTTIHGFCQSLLRQFPLEAEVSPHFTVLEDAAAESLLRRARQRVLASPPDGPLGEALALIGERLGEQRFAQLMQAITARRAAWEEIWRHQTPAQLRARIHALHGIAADRAALERACCACMDDAAACVRAALEDLAEHKPDMAETLARWLVAEDRAPLIEELSAVFLTREGTLRKNLLPKKACADDAPLRRVLADVGERVLAYRQGCAALACAEESYALALLARAVLEQYAQGKAEAQALDYEDLIARATQLLADPRMLGWVMEKLDHRIDHLLIDEAQDTSAAQWRIAEALVEELIANAGGIGSGGLPRSLLVVGDEKQSIYSFQGAAPELFAARQSRFHALLDGSDAPLGSRVLATSYRSVPAVLAVVDRVAADPEVAAALSAASTAPPHAAARAGAHGRVVLHPAVPMPEPVPATPLRMPLEYPERHGVMDALARAIADAVRGMVDRGRAPGDILVLLHQRGSLMLPLLRALQRAGVPVGGLDRLVLSDHLAVRDLLALIACCLNPSDDLALAQVLRSPLIGFSDDALRAVAHGRTGSLWSAVERPELDHWRGMRHAAPYDFLTAVLEVDGARARFAERFGAEVHEVLDELKAQAAHLPPAMPPSLAHFADWVGTSRRQIKREVEGAGAAVRVMTVHGAKGLEAPVVILADTARIPTTQKEMNLFFEPNALGQPLPVLALSDAAQEAPALVAAKEKKKQALLAEYQRLLYVAMTRAADELHVFGVANKKSEFPPAGWSHRIAAALRGLGAVEENGALVLADGPEAIRAHAGTVPKVPLPAWAHTAPPAPVAANATVAPSRLGRAHASPYAQADRGDSRARGVRMHRLLEWADATDRSETLEQLAAHVAPDWAPEERAAALAELRALRAAHPWLWDGSRRPEVSVAGTLNIHGTPVAVSGQIDLLVETPDAVVIVDYKTGRHVPPGTSDVPLPYLLQLKAYRELVTQLYPGIPVKAAIVWTAAGQLMWLDAAIETTDWPYENVMLGGPLAA